MRWPCALRLVRRDGSVEQAAVDEPAGRSFGDLLPEAELRAKFADCAGWAGLALDETAALLAQVDDLARLSTLEPLLRPLRRRLTSLTPDSPLDHNVEATTTIEGAGT
jgi:hypothetical protein